MPYTKYSKQSKKFSKKKRSIVKRKSRKPQLSYSMPFPSIRKVIFRFKDFANITSASSGVGSAQWRLNGPFDPALVGSAVQPRYWDQMMTTNLYQKYRVDYVKYTCTFINKSSSTDAIVGVFEKRDPATLPTTPTAFWHAGEFKYSTVKTLLPLGQTSSRCIIARMSTIHKILSPSKLQYVTDDNTEGLFNGNPASQVLLTLMVSDNPQNNSTSDIDVFVNLTYYCTVWQEALDVPIS